MNDLAPHPQAPAQIPRPVRRVSYVFFGNDGLRAGWSLLLYLALLAIMLTAVTWVSHKVHPVPPPLKTTQHEISVRSSFLNEGLSLLLVFAATAVMGRIENRPINVYGLGGTRKLQRFLTGLAWGAAFLSLLVLLLKLTGLLVFDRRLLTSTSMLRYGAIWLIGFLLTGLLEEYLVRGYLLSTLTRGLTSIYRSLRSHHSQTLGFWTAALLLSLVFGLGHGSNPGESPLGLVSAGLASLVFCLSLWRTGSLWWAIGFHAAWDWAQSFLYGVADSGIMVQHHLFATHPVGRPLLSGGTTGPEGSLYIVPVLALAAVVILLTLHRTQPTIGS